MNSVGPIEIRSSKSGIEVKSNLKDIHIEAREDITIFSEDSSVILRANNGPVLIQSNDHKIMMLSNQIIINHLLTVTNDNVYINGIDVIKEIKDLKTEIEILKQSLVNISKLPENDLIIETGEKTNNL